MIKKTFLDFLGSIGSKFLKKIEFIGRFTLFIVQIFKAGFTFTIYFDQIKKEFIKNAFLALPLIALTSLFTGMVLALQSYTGFSRFSAQNAIATVVVLSMVRELGPVLTGLMMTARSGSSMNAEIASMKISEQTDALITLSINPINYLVFPRVFVSTICMPLLVLISDIIGVFGGYLIAVYKFNFNKYVYMKDTLKFLYLNDVLSGIIKAFVFGLLYSIISCYLGMNVQNGSSELSKSTIKSVVTSSILILLFNYLLTMILFKVL